MKKFMMLATILVAGLLFIPNVYAAGWMFENITKDAGDSLVDDGKEVTPVIGDNKTTLTYSGKSFVMLPAKEDATDGNRPNGYAWIGFKVTNIDSSSESKKLYVKKPNSNEFTKVESSEKEYTEYVGINETTLKTALENGTKVTYTFEFAMEEDNKTPIVGAYTVVIEIDPATTILYPVGTEMTNAKNKTAEVAYNGPEAKKILDEKKAKEAEAAAAKEKEEANPNTSDINLYLLLSLIAVSGCGIAYTVKRRFN